MWDGESLSHCVVLCGVVLCCVALCCIVLYGVVLYCVALCCIVLHCEAVRQSACFLDCKDLTVLLNKHSCQHISTAE